MTLALVKALTLLAHANDEACEQAEPRLVPILRATAGAADEAARLVQHGQLDQLSDRQRKMIQEIQL